jgi:hypothetical protein
MGQVGYGPRCVRLRPQQGEGGAHRRIVRGGGRNRKGQGVQARQVPAHDLGQEHIGQLGQHRGPAGGIAGDLVAEQAESGLQPAADAGAGRVEDEHRRQQAQQVLRQAGGEREPAAQQRGPGPVAAVGQPLGCLGGKLGENVLQ